MKTYIKDFLVAGIICSFSSPVGAGFFFVDKKHDSLHPCIDYQGLNNITIKNKYPLPLINSAIDPLHGVMIFTQFNLQNAYLLVRIHKGDKWTSAFNMPLRHFEYIAMPFGLNNAPVFFQALVNDILSEFINHCAFVYLDNILIFSHETRNISTMCTKSFNACCRKSCLQRPRNVSFMSLLSLSSATS